MTHPAEKDAGCCTACDGKGGTMSGPCWDCRGTGCAHRDPCVIPPEPHEHDQAPADPHDGDTLTCQQCGYSAEFVVLDDGLPGEWVETTRPIPPRSSDDGGAP